MSLCRSCGAEIKWLELKSGKKMPVDPEPLSWDDVDEGVTMVSEEGDVRKSIGNLMDDNGMNWFISHFATCPEADDWRKR